MAKRLNKSFDIQSATVSFEVVGGETLVLDVSKLNAETRERAMYHGLLQKIGDAAAGEETAEEIATSLRTVIGQLEDNNWKAIRESAGGGARVGLLVSALARITSRSESDCAAAIDQLDDDTRKKLKGDPRVKAAMAAIRAERAQAAAADAPTVDFSKLL